MLLRERKWLLRTDVPVSTKLESEIIADLISDIEVPIVSSVQELKPTATISVAINNNIEFLISRI